MQANLKVVEELQDFKENILKSGNDKPLNVVKSNIFDLKLNYSENEKTELVIGEHKLNKTAVKKIADRFKIKKEFFNLNKKIGNQEIDEITNKLKSLENEIIFCEKNSLNEISNIYFQFPAEKRKETNNLGIIENLDTIIENVKNSNVELSVNRLSYSNNNMVNIELNTESTFEVLKDDPWKVGIQTNFSNTEFNINPFLLRKICSNGLMAAEYGYGFQSNISQMKWNTEKIHKAIKQMFDNPNDELKFVICNNVNILKNNNISIAELNKTRNLFLNSLEDESLSLNMIKKYFSNENLYQYYGNIEEKTHQYLKTADTGINAYDHFNQLTWITSHLDESGLSKDEQFLINRRAGDLLFTASNLDLSQIAPKINFNK